jgi:hypothetical protein
MKRSNLFICVCFFSLQLRAAAPAWWATHGVINTSATPDDYAAVNQGQVKNIASKAYAEMDDKMPGGAGAALDSIWASPAPSTDDYRAVNIGQLKNVAKPFYDRLGIAYPWANSASPADDYALANIGQVKNLFSFTIGASSPSDPNDTDGDGLPDAWELLHFGSLVLSASGDADGDGISNLAEFIAGSDPLEQNNSVVSLVLFSPSVR